jgi:hypothetical protein
VNRIGLRKSWQRAPHEARQDSHPQSKSGNDPGSKGWEWRTHQLQRIPLDSSRQSVLKILVVGALELQEGGHQTIFDSTIVKANAGWWPSHLGSHAPLGIGTGTSACRIPLRSLLAAARVRVFGSPEFAPRSATLPPCKMPFYPPLGWS